NLAARFSRIKFMFTGASSIFQNAFSSFDRGFTITLRQLPAFLDRADKDSELFSLWPVTAKRSVLHPRRTDTQFVNTLIAPQCAHILRWPNLDDLKNARDGDESGLSSGMECENPTS